MGCFLVVRHKKLEKAKQSYLFSVFVVLLDCFLTLMFGLFLLAWHAPGGEANIEKSCKSIGFYGTDGVGAFFAHLAESSNFRTPAYRK